MDVLLLTARVALSLGAVLALLWFLHRRFADRTGRTSERTISVIARQPLGRRSSIVVVETGGARLVLGVTDSTISMLTSTQTESIDTGSTPRPALDLVASRTRPIPATPDPVPEPVALLRDRRRRALPEPTPFERVVVAARRRLL